jgi:multidrug efflux system membrane fusion protein
MKKFFLLLVVLAVAAGGAAVFRPQLLQQALSYTPGFIRNLVPVGTQTADTGTSKKKGSGDQGTRGPVAIAVNVAAARTSSLPVIERTYGIIQSPAVAQVNARVSSQVTAIHVKDGQDVKAGDLLITLDDSVLQTQLAKDKAALLKDQAVQTSAAADLQRAKSLAAKQAGTQQAYDQAIAVEKSAEAAIASDQAAIQNDMLQLGYTKVTAPISGRLGAVQVSVGDLVGTSGNSGTSLVTVTQTRPLKVTFNLPEELLDPIKSGLAAGQPAQVKVLASVSRDVLDEGPVNFIDSTVNSASGTIAMSAVVANERMKLWPGQHVEVEVERGVLDNATVIPTVAIQPGQAGPFVWLVRDDNTVEARPVEVTRSESGLSAIAKGLNPGDRVVVEGQLKLKNDSQVKVMGSAEPETGGVAEAVGEQKATP